MTLSFLPRSLPTSALLVAVLFAGTRVLTAQSLRFADVTNSSRLAVLTDQGSFGTGLCVADFDGDGDLDLITPSRPGFPIHYWRNDGNLVFSDQSSLSGLGSARRAKSVTTADIDNDGDPDLLVANWRSPAQLFINDGTGVFVDEAAQRGLTHVSSTYLTSFGDYDNDGWLDLFIGNRVSATPTPYPADAEPDILYRNTGNGHFVDVTTTSGVLSTGLTFAGGFFDYDEDGWLDLYVACDKGPTTTPNDMFRNNRDGTFTRVGASIGVQIAIDGMSFDYSDAFNDGGLSFFVTDVPSDHLFQVWDPVRQSFTNETARFGLEGGALGWHAHFADFDLDGYEDLFVTHVGSDNALFHNPGTPASASVAWPDIAQAAGCATVPTLAGMTQFTGLLADLDNDGDYELVKRLAGLFGNGIALFENRRNTGSAQDAHWLRVELEGTASNRDARGAVLEATVGPMTMRRWKKSATGFQTDSDRRPLFGLGAATSVDRLSIRWPSGTRQHLVQVPADQTVAIREAEFVRIGTPRIGSSISLELRCETDVGAVAVIFVSAQDTPRTILSDGTELPLTLDSLATALIAPGNGLLSGAINTVDANGRAAAQLQIPNIPSLIGLQLFSTAVTVDTQNFTLVRTSFAKPLSFTIE